MELTYCLVNGNVQEKEKILDSDVSFFLSFEKKNPVLGFMRH